MSGGTDGNFRRAYWISRQSGTSFFLSTLFESKLGIENIQLRDPYPAHHTILRHPLKVSHDCQSPSFLDKIFCYSKIFATFLSVTGLLDTSKGTLRGRAISCIL